MLRPTMLRYVVLACCDRLAGALSPSQTIAACQRNISQHCWAQHVACVWPPCCDMLGVVGSSLKIVKLEPTTPNMWQHIATWWPNARNMLRQTMLRCVALACCDRLAGALSCGCCLHTHNPFRGPKPIRVFFPFLIFNSDQNVYQKTRRSSDKSSAFFQDHTPDATSFKSLQIIIW